MVDMEVTKAKSKGYERWAKNYNLKNMSKAYLLYQEKGFESPEELEAACQAAHQRRCDVLAELKTVEAAIKEKKDLQTQILNYAKTRDVRDGLKACKTEKARRAYREEHESDFIILEAAKRYFNAKGLKKLPSRKELQQEIEQLIREKNRLYNEYQDAKKEDTELPGTGSKMLPGVIGLLSFTAALGTSICSQSGGEKLASAVCGGPAEERPHRISAGCAAVRTDGRTGGIGQRLRKGSDKN